MPRKIRSALLASGLALLATATTNLGAERLNILFCFADDWGRFASCLAPIDEGPSANDVVRTPNIDRMAAEGAIFTNAFVAAPSCTPCRSSLNSGRYWWNTGMGAILQGAVWDSSIPSFPLELKKAGYHIGKSYKVWSPGTPRDAPFGGQAHAYEQAGRRVNQFSQNATKLVAAGKSVAEAREEILAEVRDNFDAFLADRQPGQPWLFWFGPTNTHRRWIRGSGQALWGIDPDDLRGKMPPYLPDDPLVREDLADYLGEAQAFDASVGVLLERLEKIGELDRTLVVISGDHGMPGVPGGKCNVYDFGTGVPLIVRIPGGTGHRVVEDFVNLMDLAPTFMEVGGASLPDGLDGHSILDLVKSNASGQIDPARTWVVTGRERHVAAAREGHLPYPMRAVRTPEFLYIRNFAPDRWPTGAPLAAADPEHLPTFAELESNTLIAFPDLDASPTKAWLILNRDESAVRPHYDFAFGKRPAEQLYDLKKDPGQTRNLAADPAYQSVRKEMAERLLGILRATHDPRVTGDGKTFDRPPFTNP